MTPLNSSPRLSSAVLFIITAYTFKLGKYQKICSVLNVLLSAAALYFSSTHLFFSPLQFFIFLPPLFFVLLAFSRLNKLRNVFKVLIVISVLVWSGIHFTQLKQLQAYYKTQHTGENWQQYGAL